MKISLSVLSIIASLLFTTTSFSNDELCLRKTLRGSESLINYQVVGDQSSQLKAAFFDYFDIKKTKKYVWKFKNISLSNISKSFTLQVHQGLHGDKDGTNGCRGSYFNTFTNEKYKNQREAQALENEQPALLIYVKRNRQFGVSKEESVYIEAFLNKIYNNYRS